MLTFLTLEDMIERRRRDLRLRPEPRRLHLNPVHWSVAHGGPGKPYPGATGIFIDNHGMPWQVARIPGKEGVRPTLYMRWDVDGDDMGGSFTDEDGVYVEPFPAYLGT